jgi:hypothetical protein
MRFIAGQSAIDSLEDHALKHLRSIERGPELVAIIEYADVREPDKPCLLPISRLVNEMAPPDIQPHWSDSFRVS